MPKAKIPASAHHLLKIIVDPFHVSTPDAEIRAEIERRIQTAAIKRNNPMPPKSVCEAYVREALKIHHANQALYASVMTGNVKKGRRSR